MKDITDKEQLRAVQYQHVDGSFELTFGGTFLLMALSFLLIGRAAPPASSWLHFLPLLALAGGTFLLDALVRWFRRRITWRRSGYLSYLPPRPLTRGTRLVIWIGIPLLAAALIVTLFLGRGAFPAKGGEVIPFLLPGFSGLLFSGLFVIVGWKIALPRFFILAAAALLVDGTLFLRGVTGYAAMAWLFGALGGMLCLSGGVTLLRYLRQNPVRQEEADER